MHDDHDAKIQQLEAQIEAARPNLEAQCANFVEAAARRLEDFWPDFVRSCVKDARDAMAELDDATVKTLKAQVNVVVAEPREVAQAKLVNEKERQWPHLSALDDLVDKDARSHRGTFAWIGSTASVVPRMPEEFTESMESAAGAPALPLEEADLPVPGNSWRHRGPSARIDWTREMEEALKAYAEGASEMFEICESLRQARIVRDKDRALNRWDEA